MLKSKPLHLLSLILLVLAQLVLSSQAVAGGAWFWSSPEPLAQVKVIEPFVEWRAGPAQGFPVFHVSEQGEVLELLIRKTKWMKVQDQQGHKGWIAINDLLLMHDDSGELVSIVEPRFDDFSTRRWEAGMMAGEFESTSVNAAYAGFSMTNNLSLELWGSQILGNSSEIRILNLNILHQPFPGWRFSPFITMGAGKLFIKPKTTLVNESSRSEDTMNIGLGARYYIDDRYFVRMEVKDYKIFTNRETNEEATEWKIGLSVFF